MTTMRRLQYRKKDEINTKTTITASVPYIVLLMFYVKFVNVRGWITTSPRFRTIYARPLASAASVGSTSRFAFRQFSVKEERSLDTKDETNVSVDDDDKDDTYFATSYHAPVMAQECISALLDCQRAQDRKSNDENKSDTKSQPLVFVDGTLGGGGHSEALLKQLQAGDIVIGCDVDPNALQTASERLRMYLHSNTNSKDKPLFIPLQTNFGQLDKSLGTLTHPDTNDLVLPNVVSSIDGLLLDLGVSSHQIDTASRGFAFSQDGPLDMRMGAETQTGFTAAHLCNEFDQDEIVRILRTYGDEPRARSIAQAIVKHRPLCTTKDLAKAIASVTPQFAKKGKRLGLNSTLARVFQSLRIVVNQEVDVLHQVLETVAPKILRPGGRLVVLSYHSVEDRATKRVMRDGVINKSERNVERDMYGNPMGPPKPFRPVGKKQKASEEEVERNRRARSATLRVADRQ